MININAETGGILPGDGWTMEELQEAIKDLVRRLNSAKEEARVYREAVEKARRSLDTIYHHSDGITKCDCDPSVNSVCDEHATLAICFDAIRDLDDALAPHADHAAQPDDARRLLEDYVACYRKCGPRRCDDCRHKGGTMCLLGEAIADYVERSRA